MPRTLLNAWDDEIQQLAEDLAAARAAQTAAQSAEAEASEDLTDISAAVQEAKDEVERIRIALAFIETPADGEPLLEDLNAALVDLRAAEAALVQADAVLRDKRAERERSTAKASTLASRHKSAEASRKAEQKAADIRAKLVADLQVEPRKDIRTTAQQALTDFRGDAEDKVEADFPSDADPDKSFLAHIRSRRAQALQILSARADAADTAAQAIEALSNMEADKLPRLQADFDAAAAKLRNLHVAGPRVADAAAVLEALATRTESPLTDAQREALFTADAALETQREGILEKLKTRDEAQRALLEAEIDYETALAAARADDPVKTDAELRAALPALQTKFTTMETKADELQDAQNDLQTDGDALADLERWFAAVPDVAWAELEALDNAIATLEGIADPAAAITDFENAEDALALQYDAVHKQRRSLEALYADADVRVADMNAEREISVRRQRAAARFMAQI